MKTVEVALMAQLDYVFANEVQAGTVWLHHITVQLHHNVDNATEHQM